ncbi:MAG: hypothetical protein QME75_05485 [Deltaproteobacteria bacterium]|nr:hypothetical protein [Deltaproteobacteria bacterium]
MSEYDSKETTNHATIRKWAEARGGVPASVKGTEKGGEEAGLLRIHFPKYSDDKDLKEISWDEFFQKFEEAKLSFLYQDKTKSGEQSRFSKFVRR